MTITISWFSNVWRTKTTSMKTKKLLLSSFLAVGMTLGVNAQIQNATNPDLTVTGTTIHTGLAIAPALDVQAVVYDDGLGSYKIDWIESATSTIVDSDGNTGNDPDVAYYSNADAVVVAFEKGGNIYVDDYYLSTVWPTPDYFMNTTTGISSGSYPNVDMNNYGDGILCWEDAGWVWVCSFNIGTFTPGPIVQVAKGSQPDVILLDNNNGVALTYIDQSGKLHIETSDYFAITLGGYSLWNQWVYAPVNWYENPRIASQRNSAFGGGFFGSSKDFTVVASDYNGSTYEVQAWFVAGGVMVSPSVLVNNDFLACPSKYPKPVVAYERDRVHIAWTQFYTGGCSGLWQTTPNNEEDVLLKTFDALGNTSTWYEEVNFVQSNYHGTAEASISTEYDGSYMIDNFNWHEAVVFNDPWKLYWKTRNVGLPNFINEGTPELARESVFSLVTSPVDQSIEILSSDDAPAVFQLMDNAGRMVEVMKIESNGNNYSLDISHLSGGTYFLKCSSTASEEVVRILHVTK